MKISSNPPPASVDNGPVWTFVHVPDAGMIGAVKPDMGALSHLEEDFGISGLAVFALTGEDPMVRIRCLLPGYEDPVTGSATPRCRRTLRATAYWTAPAARTQPARAWSWGATAASTSASATTTAWRSAARR